MKKKKQRKKKDLFYLKQLAFKEIKEKTEKTNIINESGDMITESDLDGKNKTIKKNVGFESENQLRIGGKVYRMNNQMGEIAREVLNKCKFYSSWS